MSFSRRFQPSGGRRKEKATAHVSRDRWLVSYADFITHYSVAPARVSADGYAEFHPVATNQTEGGRALNRRVDIVILASASGETAKGPAPGAPQRWPRSLRRHPARELLKRPSC